MRKLLFWIGLLITMAGFIIGQSTRIESLSSIVSPRYADASAGIKTLIQNDMIRPGQRGFSELEEMYLAMLASENDHEKLKGVAVTKFAGVANSISMVGSGQNDDGGMPVKVYLANGDVLPWGTGNIDRKIASLKDEGVLLWSSVVFSLGVLMQILSRFVNAKSRRRKRIKRPMAASVSDTSMMHPSNFS